jgi:hypothetical protein
MKPHIYLLHGIWHCAGRGALGLGYSPLAAYDDWKAA